jgi:sugar/nucleoside kinase (ribokinase family)
MVPDYVTIGGVVLDWVTLATGEVNIRGCGGNSLYSAVGAHLWSNKVAVVSRAGFDFPDTYLVAFQDAGINISGIRHIDQPHGMLWGVKYDESGNFREYYFSKEKLERWGNDVFGTNDISMNNGYYLEENEAQFNALPEEVPSEYWQASGFHVAPMVYDAQFSIAQTLKNRSIPFTFDPNSGMTSIDLRKLIKNVPIFLPSEEDVVSLVGGFDLYESLKHLVSLGPEVVVIKLGRLGSVVYDSRKDRQYHIPVFPTRVKDPTGAGDAYCGGFLVGWVETGDVFEAALRATVSASFVIEEFDARYALRFNRKDAEKRLRELRVLAS